MAAPRFSAALFGSLSVISVLVACGSSSGVDAAITRAALSEACGINSECNAPLVCAFGRCHAGCTETRDCPPPQRCVQSDRPYRVCQLPLDQKCQYNSDCPNGEICAIDSQCRDACKSDRDCITGQVCTQGACAEPTELVGGILVATHDIDASSKGQSCIHNSDCSADLVCLASVCTFECVASRDCAVGACVSHHCRESSVVPDGGPGVDGGPLEPVAPPDAPADYGHACYLNSDCSSTLLCAQSHCVYECVNASDCDSAHGFCCSAAHACVTGSICKHDAGPEAGTDAAIPDSGPVEAGKGCFNDNECQDGSYCNGYERCSLGHCAAAAKMACDDGNACTADTCNEAAKSCAYAPLGPQDQDQDGHFATTCGGDDCDDKSSDVYPGHLELCDFADNNCNGVIDEGMWNLAKEQVTPSSDDRGSETPMLFHLNDGSFTMVASQSNGGGTNSTVAWHLSAGFDQTSAPITVLSDYAQEAPAAATNGIDMIAGADVDSGNPCGTGKSDIATFSASLSSLTVSTVTNIGNACNAYRTVSRSRQAWIPSTSRYGVVWMDTHLSPTPSTSGTLFAQTVTALGSVSGPGHVLGGDLATVAVAQIGDAPIRIGVGSSAVLVAWIAASTQRVRYALYDFALTTMIGGPFDLTGPESAVPADLLRVGSGFWLVTRSADQLQTGVRMVSDSGVVGDSFVYTTPNSDADVHVAPQGPGVGLTMRRGQLMVFGWSPGFHAPFALVDLNATGANASSPAFLPTDDKHASLGWIDRIGHTLRTAVLSCGP